jgi:hypothetical protein
MPDAVKTESPARSTPARQPSRLSLNSDGQRHPILNAMTLFTFVAGIAAFACGLIVRAHVPATILGIVAFGVGLLTQLNSATREERVFIMAGVIAAFVGMAMGIAHGGFF